MISNMWFNLAVEDLEQSMTFYQKLGFKIMQRPEQQGHMFGIQAGASSPIMFVKPDTFKNYIQQQPEGKELLISLSVPTEASLDELIAKISDAGGEIIQPKHFRNGFTGCVFQDLDGHFFNVLVMDESC